METKVSVDLYSPLSNDSSLKRTGMALVMAALRSRCGHYIFALWLLSILYLFSFLA